MHQIIFTQEKRISSQWMLSISSVSKVLSKLVTPEKFRDRCGNVNLLFLVYLCLSQSESRTNLATRHQPAEMGFFANKEVVFRSNSVSRTKIFIFTLPYLVNRLGCSSFSYIEILLDKKI